MCPHPGVGVDRCADPHRPLRPLSFWAIRVERTWAWSSAPGPGRLQARQVSGDTRVGDAEALAGIQVNDLCAFSFAVKGLVMVQV